MIRTGIDTRPWLRCVAALLLPLLFCSALQVELAHDHVALAETAADGSWQHLCVDDHDEEQRALPSGIDVAGEAHRHNCDACRIGSQSRASFNELSEAIAVLATSSLWVDSPSDLAVRRQGPLPPLRGPPLS